MRVSIQARRLAIAASMLLLSAGAARAQTFDGDWEGVLDTGQEKLRGVVHVIPEPGGLPRVALDSVDQGVMGIPGQVAKLENGKVEMVFASIGASLNGTLSPDGKTFTATYSQNGQEFPLTLTRRAAGSAEPM